MGWDSGISSHCALRHIYCDPSESFTPGHYDYVSIVQLQLSDWVGRQVKKHQHTNVQVCTHFCDCFQVY